MTRQKPVGCRQDCGVGSGDGAPKEGHLHRDRSRGGCSYAGGCAKRNCFSIWPLDNTVTSLLPSWDLFPAPLVKSEGGGEGEKTKRPHHFTFPCCATSGYGVFRVFLGFLSLCGSKLERWPLSEPQTIKSQTNRVCGGGG